MGVGGTVTPPTVRYPLCRYTGPLTRSGTLENKSVETDARTVNPLSGLKVREIWETGGGTREDKRPNKRSEVQDESRRGKKFPVKFRTVQGSRRPWGLKGALVGLPSFVPRETKTEKVSGQVLGRVSLVVIYRRSL